MTDVHTNCETYEPLISALIDGELESSERNELNSHLQNCATCKRRLIAFEQVDGAVETLSRNCVGTDSSKGAVSNLHAAMPFSAHAARKAPPRTRQRMSLRLIPWAVAATLLICLGIATWPNPQPANAGLISAQQIVEPMKELHFLNRQKQQEQDLMLRTLGMDLRSMKLEINLLDLGSAERVNLFTQIESMIEKVKLMELNRETSPDE